MALTVLQKTNIYLGHSVDYPDTTTIQKVEYLVKERTDQIERGLITVTVGTATQLSYFKSNRPVYRDRMIYVTIFDNLTDIVSPDDDELISVVNDAINDIFLEYTN